MNKNELEKAWEEYQAAENMAADCPTADTCIIAHDARVKFFELKERLEREGKT